MYQTDLQSNLATAENRGRRIGEEEGIRQGQEEGMLEGEVKIKNEIALNLINLGISLDYISRATGLSADDIKNLQG